MMRGTPKLAISVLQTMAQIFPSSISEQAKKQISSSVHSSDAQVRDEAAKFILNICSDFDDSNSLLEVQKVPKPQQAGQEGN